MELSSRHEDFSEGKRNEAATDEADDNDCEHASGESLQQDASNGSDKILEFANDNCTESLDPTQEQQQNGSAKMISEEEYNDMFSQTQDTDFHGFSEISDNDQIRPDIKENVHVQNTPERDSQTNGDQSHLECDTQKNQRDELFEKRLRSIETIDDEINRSVSKRKEVESDVTEMLNKWKSRSMEPMTSTPVLRRNTRLTPSLLYTPTTK